MEQQGEITLYDIVVTDRASGRRKAMEKMQPIAGQYKAAEEARRLEMRKRDPNLVFSIERHRPSSEEELTPESLLTHRFSICRTSH